MSFMNTAMLLSVFDFFIKAAPLIIVGGGFCLVPLRKMDAAMSPPGSSDSSDWWSLQLFWIRRLRSLSLSGFSPQYMSHTVFFQ